MDTKLASSPHIHFAQIIHLSKGDNLLHNIRIMFDRKSPIIDGHAVDKHNATCPNYRRFSFEDLTQLSLVHHGVYTTQYQWFYCRSRMCRLIVHAVKYLFVSTSDISYQMCYCCRKLDFQGNLKSASNVQLSDWLRERILYI